MTKSELIEAVAQRSKITKSRAEMVVNCVFDAMTGALERGEGIEIRGYGSFTVRHYQAYDGRNPRTGKAVSVPEKRLPFFKVGKELKALVNQGMEAEAEPAPVPAVVPADAPGGDGANRG
ncbi:MAG: HU family DNA-binding protein [Myxococcales bacterium]|jgi:integration host factor subunit beta